MSKATGHRYPGLGWIFVAPDTWFTGLGSIFIAPGTWFPGKGLIFVAPGMWFPGLKPIFIASVTHAIKVGDLSEFIYHCVPGGFGIGSLGIVWSWWGLMFRETGTLFAFNPFRSCKLYVCTI